MNEPILGFFGKYRFLSNFHEQQGVTIWIDGLELENRVPCKSVEVAYQASKTLVLGERFIVAETPGIAKKLGYEVTLRYDWQNVKNDIMLELLTQKFAQPYYRDLLLATGDAYLEETNTWGDCWFGVCNGSGQNWLGKMLIQIREALRD
jgi:predicted NAD-dependent protein-ADP-ribosyltransferase YbiA (DUF1768 family)